MSAVRSSWRLLSAASAAAEAGMRVFPVVPRGKVPAIRGWERAATVDLNVIEEWWRHQPYNIGVATGPSGLLVVDLDDARGQAPPSRWPGAAGGWDVLRALAAAAGKPYPGDTFTVTTPSGGQHLYFRASEEMVLRNTAGRLGWRIDTRGFGGFVVGAGSVRRGGRYRCTNDIEIAALPQWLADALAPPAPRPTAREASPPVPQNATAYLRAIVAAETRTVADARPGTRHTTLLTAACALGRLVAGNALTEDDARTALRSAAARHVGVDAMTEQEVVRTIDDGLRYGGQRPRRLRQSVTG